MKVLVVGNGGRESSLGKRLAEDSTVCAFVGHENPSLLELASRTGGTSEIGDTADPAAVTQFARRCGVGLAVISADASLEAGVVDALQAAGIPAVGPTRSGSEIEWNKAFSTELFEEVVPDHVLRSWILRDAASIERTFGELREQGTLVAVKPQGLTGGKGVQVMGEHLATHADAEGYARKILVDGIGSSTAVVLQEKAEGIEVTLQAITDGHSVAFPPASYDYPYRYDGDTGPGTGGMGSFTNVAGALPFMSESEYREMCALAQRLVSALAEKGRHFSGILNLGVFLTDAGLRVMEVNARPGDPECMNIMEILDVSVTDLCTRLAEGSLKPDEVRFRPQASVVRYLVAPEYCVASSRQHTFRVDVEAIEASGASVYFSSALRADAPDRFRTTGNSRNVAIAALGDSIPAASEAVEQCIERFTEGPLEYRRDIGSGAYIESLRARRGGALAG